MRRHSYILGFAVLLLLSADVLGQPVSDARRQYIANELLKRIPNALILGIEERYTRPGRQSVIAIVKFDKVIVNAHRSYWKVATMQRPAYRDKAKLEASYDYSDMEIQAQPSFHLFTYGTSLLVPPTLDDTEIISLINYIQGQGKFSGLEDRYQNKLSISATEILRGTGTPRLRLFREQGKVTYELALEDPEVILNFVRLEDGTFRIVSWAGYKI